MDQRQHALAAWAEQWLSEEHGLQREQWQLTTVSGDASFRRYFRISAVESTWIAVDAPPDKEDSRPFVAVAQALSQQNVAVPEVYAYDFEQGFMLLSDLGDHLYLPQLTSAAAPELYSQALTELLKMQSCQQSTARPLPLYSSELLLQEMALFQDWFLQQLLQLSLDERDLFQVQRLQNFLLDSALEQPSVFVHRDYHSRNIMYREGQAPGVIDFQDAVWGPITYDLVSLLRDCYISWPDEQVYQWVEQFRLEVMQSGRMLPDARHFKRWFDLMGAQRHLKAIGIFARLQIRDGKPGYLADIPRTLSYVLAVTGKTYELQPIAEWLRERVLPAMYACEHFAAAELDKWLQP